MAGAHPKGQRRGLPTRAAVTCAPWIKGAIDRRVTSTSGISGISHYHDSVNPTLLVHTLAGACLALTGLRSGAAEPVPAAPAAAAQQAPAETAAPVRSALDAPLFYQLLMGELELARGNAGVAFETVLDAARRTRDETLFQRAVDIALQARAGEQAAAAVRTWRVTLPESTLALRLQVQILAALGRVADLGEPMRSLLSRSTAPERAALMLAVPRLLQRAPDLRAAAVAVDSALQPYAQSGEQRSAAHLAMGRMWLQASDAARSLHHARAAATADPAAPGPVLLAIELMAHDSAAEPLVREALAREGADPALRLSYVRALTRQQRLADAAVQLRIVTQAQPDLAGPWLTLGAVELDLAHPEAAEQALLRFVQLARNPGPDGKPRTPVDDADGHALGQAWLLLAKAAEARGDWAAAEGYLGHAESGRPSLESTSRRAALLVRQGRWPDAQKLIRSFPVDEGADTRPRLLAEAQVLREARQWQALYGLLSQASSERPDDVELSYEAAMAAEKLDKLDEMERLLRRVIQLSPKHQHAYNALGYSLADRKLRLEEARQLVVRALELAPGDPFITDSLGWVEFRLGRTDEALTLLRRAYAARPDVEIAAHLGEVLWATGQHDEARRIWSEGRRRDANNDVLRETLSRLKPGL